MHPASKGLWVDRPGQGRALRHARSAEEEEIVLLLGCCPERCFGTNWPFVETKCHVHHMLLRSLHA